mmetsp:Transcript_46273/g.119238  ORF Transcript_46273/g.119238 Transcript_46273/m.119238 type:complete len:284 (+) Transcript_46273:275-1126(+)
MYSTTYENDSFSSCTACTDCCTSPSSARKEVLRHLSNLSIVKSAPVRERPKKRRGKEIPALLNTSLERAALSLTVARKGMLARETHVVYARLWSSGTRVLLHLKENISAASVASALACPNGTCASSWRSCPSSCLSSCLSCTSSCASSVLAIPWCMPITSLSSSPSSCSKMPPRTSSPPSCRSSSSLPSDDRSSTPTGTPTSPSPSWLSSCMPSSSNPSTYPPPSPSPSPSIGGRGGSGASDTCISFANIWATTSLTTGRMWQWLCPSKCVGACPVSCTKRRS